MAFRFGIGDLVTIEGEHKEPCTAVVLARYIFETTESQFNYYILWAGRPGRDSGLHLHDKSEAELMVYASRLQLSDPSRALEQLAEYKRTDKDEILKMALAQEAERQRVVDVAGHTLKITVED